MPNESKRFILFNNNVHFINATALSKQTSTNLENNLLFIKDMIFIRQMNENLNFLIFNNRQLHLQSQIVESAKILYLPTSKF